MNSERKTTGSKKHNAWSVVARHNRRQSDEQMKTTEHKNIYQHQQRKIEGLLQKMGKMAKENAELKTEVQITNNLLDQTTRKVELIEKKLLAEENIMENIQAKEVAIIKRSLDFLKKFSSLIERDGFHVGLFGSLVRRVAEPRSRTIEEHQRFMTEFKKSDMDICVFSCSGANHPNLAMIVRLMEDVGMIDELVVSSYKQFVPPNADLQNMTEHMKLCLNFKGQKFELDLFNRKPTSNFFGGRDFSCNELQIDGHSGSLVLPVESWKPFGILDTLLDIGTKVAHPLFPDSGKVESSFISRKVSKMLERQEKLVANGYKIFPKLIGSTFSTSDEICCICHDKFSDKILAGKEVPEHYMAVCLCGNGRNLCSECLEHLLDVRDFRCPGCRQSLQVYSEKEDENKGTELLIPEIIHLSISEANNERIIQVANDWDVVPEHNLNEYFSAAMGLPSIYDNEQIWPPVSSL
jgi:hypothetical protein|tara:strand:+ start:325 stop:1719 length:1395 start_codon:yes stop_codon:yes gene_type:complete